MLLNMRALADPNATTNDTRGVTELRFAPNPKRRESNGIENSTAEAFTFLGADQTVNSGSCEMDSISHSTSADVKRASRPSGSHSRV